MPPEFAQQLQAATAPSFEKIGLKLEGVTVQNVSLPEELQKVLDQKIGMGMVGGDMGKFMQYQTAQAIPKFAEGSGQGGGGIAGDAMGLGAGVALATQGVLSNVVAGLTVIFTKPFRVGEYVSLLGEEGEVLQITLFSTTLGHPDRSRVVIPNRKVVGEILHNHGRMRQIEVTVGVAYDTDLHRAVAEIDEILRANPRVLQDPRPLIAVTLLGESSIDIVVKPWVRVPDYEIAHGEVNQAIVERFRAGGIVIPFPQREVRMLAAVAGI